MIPPQIAQYIQQLAQNAGQSLQQWLNANQDKIQELLRHGAIHAFQHNKDFIAELKRWLNNSNSN